MEDDNEQEVDVEEDVEEKLAVASLSLIWTLSYFLNILEDRCFQEFLSSL